MFTIKLPKPALTLFLLFGLTIVYVITSFTAASSQDARFSADYRQFQEVSKLVEQGQYSKADPMVSTLLQTHPKSFILLWYEALVNMGQGDYPMAENYFAKAQSQKPFLVNNDSFLLQYGQTLYALGDYQKAKKYLLRAQSLTSNESWLPLIHSLLSDTDQKLKAGN